MTNRHLLLYGFGYVARALAAHPRLADWRMTATRRRVDSGGESHSANIQLVQFPDREPLFGRTVSGVSHILSSVPPAKAGDTALDELAAVGADLGAVEWIGYLSSTSVYGDLGGAWADEETAPGPLQARGQRRRRAESAWLELGRQSGAPVQVFRLAGIYGPGRNVLERLRAGKAVRVDKPGHVMCRVHVADIVQTLLASMQSPNPGRVYNVADDCPAAQREVIEFAAELLGMNPPPLLQLDDPAISDAMRSFYLACRRIRNRRIREELGVRLAYPDYREGLAALFAEISEQPVED